MTNYVINRINIGKHGLTLYIFNMLSVKNTKKLEFGIFRNQLSYITDLPLIIYFKRDKCW